MKLTKEELDRWYKENKEFYDAEEYYEARAEMTKSPSVCHNCGEKSMCSWAFVQDTCVIDPGYKGEDAE